MQNSKLTWRIGEIGEIGAISVIGGISGIGGIKKGCPSGAVLIISEIFRCLRTLHTKNVDKKRDFKACEHRETAAYYAYVRILRLMHTRDFQMLEIF